MTFDEYKKDREGKRIDYDNAFGWQCVDLARHFTDLVHGHKINTFSWSAIRGRQTWSPFKGKPYVRVEYLRGRIPNRGDIVFFSATKDNEYWHVAIAWTSEKDTLRVIEQNAVTGNGSGLWGDAITVRNYPYIKAKVGNVLWRYTPLYLV